MSSPVISVTDVSNYIRTLINLDPFLQTLWISGELSNLKTYKNGTQCYFTLSEKDNHLQCVFFGMTPQKKSTLKNGDIVYAYGRLNYYTKRGQLNFQVSDIKPKGAGQKSTAFLMLQKKLQKEGLFEIDRKKNIPKYPEKVAIITGKASAAESDITRITNAFLPHQTAIFFPAIVQGPESIDSLLKALKKAQDLPQCELIIIARGGGSAEDLSSFNEEQLVRAIAHCPIPIISGIGHESDATLVEQVADYRAATPTHAAILASEGYKNFHLALPTKLQAILTKLQHQHNQLKTQIHNQLSQLKNLPTKHLETLKKTEETLLLRLTQSNPILKLKQGYSITRLNTQKPVQLDALKKGDTLYTEMVDGIITSHVHYVEKFKK